MVQCYDNPQVDAMEHAEMRCDPISSLKRFPVLKTLSVSDDELLGFEAELEPSDLSNDHLREALPRSTGNFSLYNCTMRIVGVLGELPENLPKHLPYLHEIVIALDDEHDYLLETLEETKLKSERPDRLDRPQEALEKAGLKCSFTIMGR